MGSFLPNTYLYQLHLPIAIEDLHLSEEHGLRPPINSFVDCADLSLSLILSLYDALKSNAFLSFPHSFLSFSRYDIIYTPHQQNALVISTGGE